MFKTNIFKAAAAVLALILLQSCGGGAEQSAGGDTTAAPQQTYEWKLVTTWPKNFPALGRAPELFADKVEAMSNGRMSIRVYGDGELVPALEVFDAVSAGTAEIGHGAAYYWKGKVPEAQFFTVLPFGMNGYEMQSWILYGGGLELWEELYEPFDLIPVPGGTTGVQMGGWFNKEINSREDFRGLKMRIPGLAQDILSRLGGVPVNMPGSELFTALQTGVLDATEWVGPYNDLAFGLYEIADYYYYPGWHEPGAVMEFLFNKEEFEALPADLQEILRTAAAAAGVEMTNEFLARNAMSLAELEEDYGVIPREFPEDLLIELNQIAQEEIDNLANLSPMGARIHQSYREFESRMRDYQAVSEEAYTRARDL
jgi:TRAP-type mannitol/chloroaromatic compound transport system substrate-binding protein